MENRTTGRILDESPGTIEAVEAWTFQRETGAGANGWKLSAIQQQGRRAA
jgi:predicted lipid-binding transport protein (Tim44 family)